MSILFSIPTLFKKSRVPTHINCINTLAKQCESSNIEYKIIITCNGKYNEDFEKWNPLNPNIIKKYSNEKYNVSKAINVGMKMVQNEDYFCLIEDDIEVLDNNWINNFIKIYNTPELNCGLLAIVPHTNSFLKHISSAKLPYKIEQHKHTDGIQFISTDKIAIVGYYDEKFKGDCDTDDYCFNLMFNGFFNYKVNLPFKHHQVGFDNKILKTEDDVEFSKNVRRSRIRLKEKWNLQLGWRRSTTGIYDGWKQVDGKWEIDNSKTNLHPPGYIEQLQKDNLI